MGSQRKARENKTANLLYFNLIFLNFL